MKYVVITDVPLHDEFVQDIRVFDSIEDAKYYKWKQDSEYCPAKLYEL